MSHELLLRLFPADLAWAIKALQRYVEGRKVDAEFVRLLARSDAPGALIDPVDPDYGRQVLDALLATLERRMAAHLRAKPDEKATEPARTLIRDHLPICFEMMQRLEKLGIGYQVTRLTIDGQDRLG